ncbi:hypothetical protein PROFUN_12587 [Planoprotostelium fungivorum]|uniref:Carboxylesterase type B domain-containing protein n=1 Tax=Planoprotostelium fungivorum TaxID=1890364 RepID=A0A2P6N6W0_9EUKA|nr:hypothetical protein PROFUN_12587 [Planoprotostelium fungivorum]
MDGALRGEVPYQEIEESTHVLSYVSGILNNWARDSRKRQQEEPEGLGLRRTCKLWKEIGEQHHFNVRAITRAISNVLLEDPRVDPSVDPSVNNNEALRIAAERGNLSIVRLLLTSPRVDPSVLSAYPGITLSLDLPSAESCISAKPDVGRIRVGVSLFIVTSREKFGRHTHRYYLLQIPRMIFPLAVLTNDTGLTSDAAVFLVPGMKITTILFTCLTLSAAQLFNVTINGNNTFVGQKNATLPDVIQYLNIPFAQPPLGPLRFRPPVPLNVTNTLTVCNNTQPACVQPDGSGQEDCLYLAVFVPATANVSSNLPVRIFIHGGAFISASYDSISGAALAAQTNTIVVEGNYRLGLFGFMVSAAIVDANSTGNYGLLDQQLSLKWVHQNIRNFGGNPDDITIDGGSAGSASVYWHTLMPKSWPYYNRVIVSSAGYWRYSTLEDKVALTDKRLRSLNINCSNIVCLQNLNVSTLSQVPAIVYGVPVIDGVNLLDQPLLLFDAGRYKPNTSFIIGINKDEGTNLSEGFYDGITALLPTLTTSVILQELAVILNYNASLVPNVVSAYNFPQTYTTAVFNVSSAEFRSWIDFVGELIIDCGSIAAIKSLASQGTPVHAYYFDYVNDDPYSRLYGAYHSSEVEYKYNLTGNGNADQQKVSATFVNYFEQYQLNSDPNPVVSRDTPRAWSNVRQNGLYWPLYNTSTNSTLIINMFLVHRSHSEKSIHRYCDCFVVQHHVRPDLHSCEYNKRWYDYITNDLPNYFYCQLFEQLSSVLHLELLPVLSLVTQQ